MYSFIISICALILGYLFYGKFVEKAFGPDPKAVTPAVRINDGVDYIPMPKWKMCMIQFLNIAGTGPIFGAIMGAKFGPACYLWIVFGSIFAGAVHDYISGMISLRFDGASLPDTIGHFLGRRTRTAITIFLLLMMLLVGAVFVYSPALILADLSSGLSGNSGMLWVLIILAYYIIATLLPIDKIIGRIYPIFAIAILFMAVALTVCLFVKWPSIPEFWDGLHNRGPEVGVIGQSIFPCLFITVACGAISGFHATQSPLMARCMTNEKQGRPIFYGSMILEGVVALVWAAIGSYFFFDGGMAEVGAPGSQAPQVVTSVAKSWLGIVGSILAILGVVAAPISTGDTAFRSARLMAADMLKIDQKPYRNRILTSLPLFALAGLLLWYNIADANGFNNIWRYFGLVNQALACFTLWALSLWMIRTSKGMKYLITVIPAVFMTAVCVTFLLVDPHCFALDQKIVPHVASATAAIAIVVFSFIIKRQKGKLLQ